MSYKSKFKHLVVSGCSFTSNRPSKTPWNWPDMLANWTGMEIHNHGIPGAGNSHIAKSIILYLEEKKLDPAETLVIAMWSQFHRTDWIVDPQIGGAIDTADEVFLYNYRDSLALASGASSATFIRKYMNIYRSCQSSASTAVENWLTMKMLSQYLETKKYRYFYTSFFNFNLEKNISCIFNEINYTNELNKLGLSVDEFNWIKLSNTDYYGDWCEKMSLLDDTTHPFSNAPERWPREVLIPYLKEQNILYE